MSVDGSNASRLPTLTGLRFFAALLVFGFHASLEGFFADPAVDSVFGRVFDKAGWVGVSFFFVLSGFVLTWSARDRESNTGFWRRRIVKIYPTHLVMWLVAAALLLVTGAAIVPGQALPNLLLVHSWVPNLPVIGSMNDVSWSLSCELFFYLSFPLLLRWIRRIPASRLWWCAGAVVLVIFTIPLVAELLPQEPVLPWHPTPVWEFWFVYTLPPVRLLDFALGMLMARIVLSGRWIGLRLGPATLLALAGYTAALYVPYTYGLGAATVVPVALLVAAAAAGDVNGTRSPLRGRFALWLGEISFAFYMMQRLLLIYGHNLLGDGEWGVLTASVAVLGFFVVAVVLAWLMHTAVERPAMRRWGRGRRRRRVGPSPAVPAS